MSIYDDNPTSPPTTLTPTDEWGLEPLMDVHELAAYLGIPISTVYDWRVHGKGPAAYRFGKHLKFAISDVRACLVLRVSVGLVYCEGRWHRFVRDGSHKGLSSHGHRRLIKVFSVSHRRPSSIDCFSDSALLLLAERLGTMPTSRTEYACSTARPGSNSVRR
jgi:excisionase family DNA binding protein